MVPNRATHHRLSIMEPIFSELSRVNTVYKGEKLAGGRSSLQLFQFS